MSSSLAVLLVTLAGHEFPEDDRAAFFPCFDVPAYLHGLPIGQPERGTRLLRK